MSGGDQDAPGWIGGRDGLRWGPLLVSFQRFAPPTDDLIEVAPPSLGALPVAAWPPNFLLPLAQEEAFWLGICAPARPPSPELVLEIVRPDGRRAPFARFEPGGTMILPGLPRPDRRFHVLRRSALVEIVALYCRATATVRLCDPAEYGVLTGTAPPEPLNPNSGYGGWRLP